MPVRPDPARAALRRAGGLGGCSAALAALLRRPYAGAAGRPGHRQPRGVYYRLGAALARRGAPSWACATPPGCSDRRLGRQPACSPTGSPTSRSARSTWPRTVARTVLADRPLAARARAHLRRRVHVVVPAGSALRRSPTCAAPGLDRRPELRGAGHGAAPAAAVGLSPETDLRPPPRARGLGRRAARGGASTRSSGRAGCRRRAWTSWPARCRCGCSTCRPTSCRDRAAYPVYASGRCPPAPTASPSRSRRCWCATSCWCARGWRTTSPTALVGALFSRQEQLAAGQPAGPDRRHARRHRHPARAPAPRRRTLVPRVAQQPDHRPVPPARRRRPRTSGSIAATKNVSARSPAGSRWPEQLQHHQPVHARPLLDEVGERAEGQRDAASPRSAASPHPGQRVRRRAARASIRRRRPRRTAAASRRRRLAALGGGAGVEPGHRGAVEQQERRAVGQRPRPGTPMWRRSCAPAVVAPGSRRRRPATASASAWCDSVTSALSSASRLSK